MRFRFLAIIIFLFPVFAFAQKITINKTSVAPGEAIEVKYSTGGLTDQHGWIGVIPSSTPHGSANVNDTVDVDYQYTSQPEGTMTFRAPLKAGSWDFRMNQAGGGDVDKELASVTFQVVAVEYKTKLQPNKTTFTPGEEITLTFSVQSQLPQHAWIGVIPSNIEHGSEQINDQHDVDYQYVSEKSGTLKFKAPEKAGKWDFRLNDSDSADAREIGSVTFEVSSVKLEGTLKLKKKSFVPGEEIELEFTAPEELSPTAWIGMIPSNVPHGDENVNDQHDIQYQYLQKKGSGVMKFTAPPEGGSYDFRLNSSDSNGVEITSVSFQVGGSLNASAMARAIEEKGKVTLYGINFDFNQSTIKAESEPVLKEVAALLQQQPELRLRIEGHTDNVGKPAYNLDLSKKRAESVKTYLTGKFQIDPSRLATEGFGDSKPIAKNDTDQGRAQNRRVELVKQ
jgi:outer membrane protein OmpA-like peptidoglycan-associated protein